jgi:hypothetical protein
VKEGQEPALVLADGFGFSDVAALLEWAPLIIVLPEALEFVIASGIKADVILTSDANQQAFAEKFEHQMPVKFLPFSRAHNGINTALEYLIATDQPHVNIWCTEALKSLPGVEKFVSKLAISVLDQKLRCSAITSGVFTKWFARDSIFEVVGTAPFHVTIGHFHQSPGKELVVGEDGLIQIVSDGIFWICEHRN